MIKTLLPPNSTSYEKNIEHAVGKRLEAIPSDIGRVWRYNDCPLELLPWLAWSLSVDNWDSDWSEDVKREVIRRAARVHKHKGTVYAVKQALKSLGVTVQFLEWFNQPTDVALVPIHDTTPGTFVFIAWANQNPYVSNAVFLSEPLFNSIKNVVNRTKPASAHYRFVVGARTNSILSHAALSQGAQVIRTTHDATAVQTPASQHTLNVGFFTRAMSIGRFYLTD